MTASGRYRGELVQLLPHDTVEVRQPIHAVCWRNTAPALRIGCFLDFLSRQLAERAQP